MSPQFEIFRFQLTAIVPLRTKSASFLTHRLYLFFLELGEVWSHVNGFYLKDSSYEGLVWMVGLKIQCLYYFNA
jgi:hypothetical protein